MCVFGIAPVDDVEKRLLDFLRHRPAAARADGDAEPEARQAGFAAFIRKPLTGGMLAEVMARALKDAAAHPHPPHTAAAG